MNKKILCVLLVALTSVGATSQTAAQKSLYKTFTDTYETKADSMTNAFIESFMIKNKGYFNSKYQSYAFNAYWQQAHAIDVVVYNYQRHKSIDYVLANKYLSYIKLWYTNKGNNYSGASVGTSPAYKMFENPYTDDMCWITLTLLHMADVTGMSSYATTAKGIFDNYIITRGTEDEETGGIWLPWNNSEGSGANACTQSPATLIAAKLYQRYGNTTTGAKYLEYAKKLYAYAAQKIVKADYRVEEPPLTYTQGTFAEACRILYHVTDEASAIKTKYKLLAYQYNNYAFTSSRCTNGSNILRNEGSSGDQSIFKAVLIPYAVNFVLDEDMLSTNRVAICKYILKNASTLWGNLSFSRYPIVFCNYFWAQPWTGEDADASMGAMASGSSLIENTARMCRVISDRYNMGTLITECNKLVLDSVTAADPELATYTKALTKAKEIMAAPGDYTIAEFRTAYNNLQAALPGAQDYVTRIDEVGINPQDNRYGVFTLDGRLVRTPWQSTDNLPAGLYIVNGKKKLVK